MGYDPNRLLPNKKRLPSSQCIRFCDFSYIIYLYTHKKLGLIVLKVNKNIFLHFWSFGGTLK